MENANCAAESPNKVGVVYNSGSPIRFKNVELAGFAAESCPKGAESVKVCTRLALTSDDPFFHKLTESFSSHVDYLAQQAGTSVQLNRAETILLVIKSDNTAELWLDTAAVSLLCMVNRDSSAGAAIYEKDIADITGMSFPCVNIEATDRVLCIFRKDWRFALAFDFNPKSKLDVDAFTTTLGKLYRELHYRHLYEALANQTLFDSLIDFGWFPFAEIISSEFKDILKHCEAGFDMEDIETSILEKFDEPRMERIARRWIAKPHFAARRPLLRSAIDAYKRSDPVAVIKILLTEIEGVLNDAHRATHDGKGAKLNTLLKFAVDSAEQKAGQSDTLLFPKAFAQYLAKYTFANFNPVDQLGSAGSRHAVGHGAAAPESYTMPRALQTILTLDQLAFYT